MMFTFESYRRLLDSILECGYDVHGIEKIIISRRDGFAPKGKFVAIRHDVDYFPKRAQVLAAIEAERNLATTYYIRRKFFEDDIDTIRKIAEYGHQIGYHYEEADTHQKAPNLQIERDAVGFFVGSLLDLDRLGFPIKTVCAHGNPMTDVDNRQVVHLLRSDDGLDRLAFTYDRDLIKAKISDQLVGDASIDITGKDFDLYIPDTGRFNPKFNLKDRIDDCPLSGLSNLDHLKRILTGGEYRRIYMNMHPDRWSGNWGTWLFDFGFDTAKNLAKKLIGKSSYQGQLVGEKAKKHHRQVMKSLGEKSDETENPRS
ncbi:MAG: hypothetical protein GY841_17800 [FCB group bacterium]|nr:hypothetical protein [FCB group bacterium]